MTFSVLSAKLHRPQLAEGVISRTGLLKDSQCASVILVSAQAGSGKSTIISAWLSEQDKSHLWYSLDEWDNDLTQFFTYLIAGIQTMDGLASERLAQLFDAYQSIGFDSFLQAMIHQLHAIDHPFILVFDDYQVIRNDQVHQVIRAILEHMPKSMQLVLITREDPPLPLAKLRAGKKLLELRISQLRFTEEETKTFFSRQLHLSLKEEQLQDIFKRTEGWISGLQLAALSLQGIEDVNGFIDAFTGSHYYMMDYLMEEVLERQTPEIKDFLLKTALLEFFSGELCDAVLQLASGNGSAIIERLVRTNSFIIPMDSSRKWYRYHHLFRDLLRQRLEQQPGMEMETLHHRAGCWFKMAGREQEAIHHFLKANAAGEAAALIECKWAEMDIQLQAASWLDMAKRLPMSIVEKSPVLSMGYGWALLDTGKVEDSRAWFDKAQALHDLCQSDRCPADMQINDRLQFDLLPATIASARGYMAAATGDVEGIFKHARDALARIPSDQSHKRGLVAMLLAVAHWSMGELDEAEAVMMKSMDDVKRAGNPLAYHSIHMVLGELYIQQRHLDKASAILSETVSRVLKENQVPILLANLYLDLAKIAFLSGEYQQAYSLLEESKAYGQKYSLVDWKYKYYLLLSRVYCREGFYELARDSVRESKTHYCMNPIPEDISIEEMEIAINTAEASGHQAPASVNEYHDKSRLKDSPDADGKSDISKRHSLLRKEHANQSLSESLTVRELEVLALVASGLSNQEICDTLFLALSTVKGYNQAIFGKLQVKHRTKAVVKAKALGLV